MAGRSLRKLVGNLFGGSPRHAIAWLLREEDLADADLEEIHKMIAAQKRRKKERS